MNGLFSGGWAVIVGVTCVVSQEASAKGGGDEYTLEVWNQDDNYTSWFGNNNRGTLVGNAAAPDDFTWTRVWGIIDDGRGGTLIDEESFPGIDFDAAGFMFVAALDVNDRGEAVGEVYDPIAGAFVGWRRDLRGRVELLPVQGNYMFLTASGINNAGTVVGTVNGGDGDWTPHGYVLSGGRLTPFDVPGSDGTSVEAIDDRGRMVGRYRDVATGRYLPYLADRGRFQVLGAPQIDSGLLFPHDINNRGQVTGTYLQVQPDGNHRAVGFMLTGRQISLFDFEGSELDNTEFYGINDKGDVAGTFDFLSWGLVGTRN